MESGKLVKFKIESFKAEDFSGEAVDTFEVMFNPNNYSLKYEVQYKESQGAGDTASPMVYEKIKPQELNFEFLIDGTGTISEKKDVSQTINHFFTVVGYDGEIHRPRYLKLSWGELLVKCVLKSAEVAYSLFKPGGEPLRAKIRASFAEIVEDNLRVAQEDNNSPDLTHMRTVVAGDTLTLMTERIYGDPAYYYQVAEVNQLVNFRKLKVGQRLFFPPIKTLTK